MADVHTGTGVVHSHALLATVLALIAALLLGAGAVVLYYEVIDSDVTVLAPPTAEPVVEVVTPEQVQAARAIDKHEAERAVGAAAAFGGAGRADVNAPTSSLAGTAAPDKLKAASGQLKDVPARVESLGRIPVDKK